MKVPSRVLGEMMREAPAYFRNLDLSQIVYQSYDLDIRDLS